MRNYHKVDRDSSVVMTGPTEPTSRPILSGVSVFWMLLILASQGHVHTSPVTSQRQPPNLTAINGTDSLRNASHEGAPPWLCSAQYPTPSCPCGEDCAISNCCCDYYAEFCETGDGNVGDPPQFENKSENEQLLCQVWGESHGYLLVSTCREDSKGTFASTNCPGEGYTSKLSISNVPVTSLSSGVSYKNIYCAVCNHETVENLRAWPTQVLCDSERDYEVALGRLRSSRDLATGAVQELGCNLTVTLPVAIGGVRNGSGKQMLCACSRHPGMTRCRSNKYESTEADVFVRGKPSKATIVPPISVLLDFGSSSHVRLIREETVVSEERVACPDGRVFDPFASRCRRLFCSDGYALVNRRCVVVPRQGSAKKPDVKIDVTRTAYGNDIGSRCMHDKDETRFCLASFLGIEVDDITLDTTKHPETDIKTSNCSYTFLLDSSKVSFQTLWTHLLLSQSPTAISGMCHNSGVWFVRVERKTNATMRPCRISLLNTTELQSNWTDLVEAVGDLYSSDEQVAVQAIFDIEQMNFSISVEVELCEEAIFTCPLVYLNRSLFREVDATSQSMEYIPTGQVFTVLEYRETAEGSLELCSFLESNGTRNATLTARFFKYSETQAVLSLVGNVVSMVCGGATFLTYFVFDVLRNHATCCIINLVASLFMAQLLLLLTGSATANPAGCSMVAALGHYFWLANVFWTGVLAYDLHKTFTGKSCIAGRGCDTGNHRPRLRSYALLAWGGSLLVVVPCLAIDLCDCTEIPIWYGNSEVCWIGNGQSILVVFAAPVACIVLANTVLFVTTVWSIRKTNRETQHNLKKNVTKVKMVRKELLIYIKISTLMGFTWIAGFAAALSDLGVLWYVFILLNSLQGVLIFLSFTCKQRVRILWMEAFCAEASRKRSYSLGIASSSASASRITRV